MSGKAKHAEVTSARIRLDATLQHLVDKKDDGNLSSDGEGLSHLDLLQSDPSPLPSPSKKAGSRQSRKRKRKDDSDLLEGGQYHHTYVMKLFDRSVDLAQFDEEAALYPICRAWLKNQPSNRRLWPRERTPDPEPPVTDHDDEEVDQLQDVYKMPPPIKDDPDCLMQDFRIPAPIPQPTERLDINANQNQAPPPEQLLLEHMHRWKETRTSWREAGFLNEMKFAASMNLLREIFESQMKEEVP